MNLLNHSRPIIDNNNPMSNLSIKQRSALIHIAALETYIPLLDQIAENNMYQSFALSALNRNEILNSQETVTYVPVKFCSPQEGVHDATAIVEIHDMLEDREICRECHTRSFVECQCKAPAYSPVDRYILATRSVLSTIYETQDKTRCPSPGRSCKELKPHWLDDLQHSDYVFKRSELHTIKRVLRNECDARIHGVKV